ncbi:MAG: hypothetical protein WCH11_02690 [Bdellovibrio sp.]
MISILKSPAEFFLEEVESGLSSLRVQAAPAVKSYLVSVLQHHIQSGNLFDEAFNEAGQRQPQTMAELFLQSQSLASAHRFDMLKKVGDRSLYLSGFFSDSFNRKLVDVDYYVDIGGAAYRSLAEEIREDVKASVYKTMAERFIVFVDVLSLIAQKSGPRTNTNLLRTYEKYLRTGSELAKEKLLEAGIFQLQKTDLKKVGPN